MSNTKFAIIDITYHHSCLLVHSLLQTVMLQSCSLVKFSAIWKTISHIRINSQDYFFNFVGNHLSDMFLSFTLSKCCCNGDKRCIYQNLPALFVICGRDIPNSTVFGGHKGFACWIWPTCCLWEPLDNYIPYAMFLTSVAWYASWFVWCTLAILFPVNLCKTQNANELPS